MVVVCNVGHTCNIYCFDISLSCINGITWDGNCDSGAECNVLYYEIHFIIDLYILYSIFVFIFLYELKSCRVRFLFFSDTEYFSRIFIDWLIIDWSNNFIHFANSFNFQKE